MSKQPVLLVSELEAYSDDYATARQRFGELASKLGWQLESHSIGITGPSGEDLSVDVAWSEGTDSDKALLVSSGVHGVEGLFGSAVQVALLEQWQRGTQPEIKTILLHAVNPFGFAWLRRCDENNVDLNRNFLLDDEAYAGAPPLYGQLDPLLNPKRPPSRFEPFLLKALIAVARHGMPALQQAIACGQYEFPQGLFFGGHGPSRTYQMLGELLGRLLTGVQEVVQLDLHTGLGKRGGCRLLIDYPLTERQRTQMTDWFGQDVSEVAATRGAVYSARGGLGRWCAAQELAASYLYACAEFGTYHPIAVLAGLRAENQSHHWGSPSEAATIRAKERLKELFCPRAPIWRAQALAKAIDLVDRAVSGLAAAR